jgi:exopolysaccharide biosynthesis polyprenyl glycosylphosphotransferase
MAHREAELLTLERTALAPRLAHARLPSWAFLQKFVYLWSDLLALVLAHMLAVCLVQRFLHVPTSALNLFQYHRFYIPFFAVVLYLFEGYKSLELRRPEQELERGCKAVAASFLGLVLFNFVVFRSEVFSRYLLASWLVLSCVLLLTLRFVLRAVYERLWKAGLGRRRALLIGSPAGLSGYQQLLTIQRHHAYELAGMLLDSPMHAFAPEETRHLPLLGSPDRWEEVAARTGANLLIVAYGAAPGGEEWLTEILRRCKQLRIDVELYSDALATANLNYEHNEFSGCFRFYTKSQWSLALQGLVKRGTDVAIGLVGSAVTLLLTPAVWLLVNLEDGGPTFYKREFIGCDGKIHYYRKFRTMLENADEILRRDPELKARFVRQYKLKDDPRVLRVGRFLRRYSLDEFPQFFSLLTGQLTFVGPRVISDEERYGYGDLLPKLLSFKPGLTGFWQVMGRQTTTYEERIRMDMFYIDRWSIWLDLVIIAKTFWKVLRAEGAY